MVFRRISENAEQIEISDLRN